MTTTTQATLSRNGTQALYYAERGRMVAPAWWIKPDGTCACSYDKEHSAGKHPVGLFYAQEQDLERADYVFVSRKGGHITKQRVDQVIKAAAHRAKLQRSVHAHLFRHGYAINFLNCSGRLDALQEQLGHKDINTTRIYLRLSDEDVKREVNKSNFRNGAFGN